MKSQAWVLLAGLVWLVCFTPPLSAQGGAALTPPNLTDTSFPDYRKPVPVDEHGNPIPLEQPSDEQVKAQRIEQEQRAEKIRVEEEVRLAEATRHAEEERRTAELLAEEKQFHDRVMWAIYIGLGILAIFVGSRLFKQKE